MDLGNIRISDDVVKVVAAKAAVDVPGVYKMSGGVADEVNKILGKKNNSSGIKVEVGEKECSVDTYLIVEYGVSIPEVATNVQEKIVKDITEITGLKVVEVNVYVQDVHIPVKKAEEKEEKLEPEIID